VTIRTEVAKDPLGLVPYYLQLCYNLLDYLIEFFLKYVKVILENVSSRLKSQLSVISVEQPPFINRSEIK
jgi:hypothetical protein